MTLAPLAVPTATGPAAERATFELSGRPFGVTYPAGEFMRAIVREIVEGREYPVLRLPDGPPEVIVDVGANVGATAVFFHAAYPDARILCYEPSAENLVWLRGNVRGLDRVEVHPYGLLDRDVECPLYAGRSQCAQRSVIPGEGTTPEHELVRLRRASAELAERGLDRIGLLKLDTEGCELAILRDLLPAVARVDVIAVEYHSEEDRLAIDALLAPRFLLLYARADALHQGRLIYLAREVAARHPDLEAGRIAPLPVGGMPSPMEAVTLRFETTSGPQAVNLTLDRTRGSQRAMLAALETGGFHTPEVSYFLTNVLHAGDTVVDAGAQIGYFTLLAARAVGAGGRVFAFEPEPGNYRRLRDHVERNQLGQVQSFNIALGSAAGSAELSPDGPGRGQPVEVAVLDHVLSGLPPEQGPRVLRLGAGGMEYEILKGAVRTLLGHEVPFVLCHIDRAALASQGSSEAQLRGFMRLIGYQVSLLSPDGSGMVPLDDEEIVEAGPRFHLLFRR